MPPASLPPPSRRWPAFPGSFHVHRPCRPRPRGGRRRPFLPAVRRPGADLNAVAPLVQRFDLDDLDGVDPAIDCARCDAVCCRLTVVLDEHDRVAEHLTTYDDAGLHVMARDEEGWCVAVDAARMCCSIYESRPAVCRRFVMGAPYCQAVRTDYAGPQARSIPLNLC